MDNSNDNDDDNKNNDNFNIKLIINLLPFINIIRDEKRKLQEMPVTIKKQIDNSSNG